MSIIESEVDEAIAQLGLATHLFVKLSLTEARAVLSDVRIIFVDGNPSSLWQELKVHYQSIQYTKEEWPGCLLKACTAVNGSRGLLILESSSDDYPVYRCESLALIPRVLAECSFFEYYLVDESLRWLIADTEHNEILIATSP